MPKVVRSPHRFKERILAFGGGGVGKSSITCNMARYMPYANFHVVDMDYSAAYERLLATEYTDVYDRGNVKVYEVETEWEALQQQLLDIIAAGDPVNDVLTIDPTTVTWQMVQSQHIQHVFGDNIADHMAELRKEAKDLKEYSALLTSDMTWPIINKQYQEKFYAIIRRWKGHLILVCEAQEITKQEESDVKAMFGFVGYKPSGQKSLMHVGATNIYLDHPSIRQWRMTTVKDRGRPLIERMPFDDFTEDYLVAHGGWEMGFEK